ncbi:DMT family transporter [Endozoicomonas lisbonensis]|uniref:Drug/metabolite transporter (DMT)-like permease n=1 Tax=Endozoicomonas lisbonensis TaxID=3120522 RepID=A0ABV2SC58_9GAMM
MKENTPKGVAYAVATAVIASTAAASTKLIAVDVPVPMIVLVQYSICLVVMLPWLLRNGSGVLKTQRPAAHLMRGLTGWLCFYVYYLALAHIPLVDATLLRNTGPLFVPLAIWLWLKVVIPRKSWGPMILGFCGVLLILRPQFNGINPWHIVGLLSGFFLAFSMVGTRTLSTTEPSSLILFYYFAISFLCSLPLAIANWQAIPLWTLPWLAYVGLSIFITMWLYTQAYTWAKATVVAPVNYLGVVFAGFLGWLMWGHVPDTVALSGMVLVVGAGLLSIYLGATASRQKTGSSVSKQTVSSG